MENKTIFITALLCLVSCDSKEYVRDFIGCKWDVENFEFRTDDTFTQSSQSQPIKSNYSMYFYDEAGMQSMDTLILLDEFTTVDSLIVRFYMPGGDTPGEKLPIYLIKRSGFSGEVLVFNNTYSNFLISCESQQPQK